MRSGRRLPKLFFAAVFLVTPVPAMAQGWAEVTGLVFNDANRNAKPDLGDSGFAGVTLTFTHNATGEQTSVVSGAGGSFRYASDSLIDHTITVDTATLPISGELTTGRESYSLRVPPEFVAPNVNFGYREVESAVVSGTVFNDLNANGRQDPGEPGFVGVTVTAKHDETGIITIRSTGPGGIYRFEGSPNINHRIAVETSTLPFPAELTSGRATHDMNVPPGFTGQNVNFGYREIEPAVVSGTVFHDANGNGTKDADERGIPDVSLVIAPSGRAPFTVSTSPDGSYEAELSETRFSVTAVQPTLPFLNPVLTTGPATYTLNVPNGYTARNARFGFREADPEEDPTIEREAAASERPLDTVPTLPLIAPDTTVPAPAEPAPPSPITGLWSFFSAPYPFECVGLGTVMVVGSETCTARMTISSDRKTLTGEPESCDGDSGSIFGPPGLPNQASPSGGTNASMALMEDGTYRLALDLAAMGMDGNMTFVFDFISDTEMTGYLEGAMKVDGMSCSMRREITAMRVGD